MSAARLPLLALAILLAACSTPVDPIAPALDAAPPEPAPPCIHEVCADRPTRLRCANESMYFCRTYVVDYEWHCRCDTWGVVARDGGP